MVKVGLLTPYLTVFWISKLLEMHGEAGKVVTKKDGEQVVTDNYEPPVLESV